MSIKNDCTELELTLEELIEIVFEALRLPEGTFKEYLELYTDLKGEKIKETYSRLLKLRFNKVTR